MAVRAYPLPDRVPQPAAGIYSVGLVLRHLRTRSEIDYRERIVAGMDRSDEGLQIGTHIRDSFATLEPIDL